MNNKTVWKGREITGHDPELQAHITKTLEREFLPYALADKERARRILRKIMKDKDGNEYLADFDGNYIGPLPDYLRAPV